MKFTIEQIAICPRDPKLARNLLEDMGAVEWVEDDVTAEGAVHGEAARNKAHLSFNYTLVDGKEFEILHYTKGDNWMEGLEPRVSHFGMHCSAEELKKWREFFRARRIAIVQEVNTVNHTNPAIAGKRMYNYVIFGTRDILGVDIKFIVRHFINGEPR